MKKILLVLILTLFVFGSDQKWKDVDAYMIKTIGYDHLSSTLYIVTIENDTLYVKDVKRSQFIAFRKSEDVHRYYKIHFEKIAKKK